MSILGAFANLAGVLIAFTAVVGAQVLSAYRSQIDRNVNVDDVMRRRKNMISTVRSGLSFLVGAVLVSVILMARQSPRCFVILHSSLFCSLLTAS